MPRKQKGTGTTAAMAMLITALIQERTEIFHAIIDRQTESQCWTEDASKATDEEKRKSFTETATLKSEQYKSANDAYEKINEILHMAYEIDRKYCEIAGYRTDIGLK